MSRKLDTGVIIMKKLLIVFALVFILTLAVPFISLLSPNGKEKNAESEMVTLFNGALLYNRCPCELLQREAAYYYLQDNR